MFERILFATDFSEYNLRILDYLPEFKDLGVREVVVVRVINLNKLMGVAGGINIDEYIEECQKEANDKMKDVVSRIEKVGLKAKPVIPCPAGDPVNEILRTAKENNVDLILMGSRGRGILKEILLGSVSEGVVRKAEIPVMVVRHKAKVERLFERILYAHDLSEYAGRVMKYVKYVAEKLGSEILLVHVIEKGEALEKDKLEAVEAELKDFNVKTIIGHGSPHKEILKIAKDEKATSIFIGSRGAGSITELLLGSTADAIIRYSKIPVFVSRV